MSSAPTEAEPGSPPAKTGQGESSGVHFPFKELGKEELLIPWGCLRRPGTHPDMIPACVLGLAYPVDPKELMLGIVINKQWQKAAGGFGFDK